MQDNTESEQEQAPRNSGGDPPPHTYMTRPKDLIKGFKDKNNRVFGADDMIDYGRDRDRERAPLPRRNNRSEGQKPAEDEYGFTGHHRATPQ